MGKVRHKTRTTFIIITPAGKLRELRPLWVTVVGLGLIGMMVLLSGQFFSYNQRLIHEEKIYRTQLLKRNAELRQLEVALELVEQKKEQISGLLFFNDDSEKAENDKK